MIRATAIWRRAGLAVLTALALTSCAKDKSEEGPVQKKVVSKGTGMEGDDYDYIDNKFGVDPGALSAIGSGQGKRSQFDGKQSIAFGGGVGKAAYRTPEYSTPDWNGNTVARTSPYEGKTDGSQYQTQSRFQGTSASQMAQRSRFEGTTAATSNYTVPKASENTAQRMEKPTDGWTDFRRRVYPDPVIMSKADYERLTVEQTRSILGRD